MDLGGVLLEQIGRMAQQLAKPPGTGSKGMNGGFLMRIQPVDATAW